MKSLSKHQTIQPEIYFAIIFVKHQLSLIL